jgi:hypothetical protein
MSPLAPRLGNVVVGALLGWVTFTALTGWITFSSTMSTALTFSSGIQEFTAPNVVNTVIGALTIGFWTLVVAGSVSFIVTAIVGIPLGWLAGSLLRRVSAWWAHACALFAVGATASSLTLFVYGQMTSGYLGMEAVPLYAVAGVLAGVSAALGWVILWRFSARPVVGQGAYAESVASL